MIEQLQNRWPEFHTAANSAGQSAQVQPGG